ncbi:MAG: asparaginase domain-containing protein, partial [Terriglobales bacterium]
MEVPGVDFLYYRPFHLLAHERVEHLAKSANTVQRALKTGKYNGAIWLEGSPSVEETAYWLNLLVDTTLPISANAAQRVHGQLSGDGDRNIVDSVDYIVSRQWADEQGRNRLGVVVTQDEQIFAARQVTKADARPGGYIAAGGHGGILGTIGDPGPVTIYFEPKTRHTWNSEVSMTRLPASVQGVKRIDGKIAPVQVQVKNSEGYLRAEAIPKVTIVKAATYSQDTPRGDPAEEVEVLARIEKNLLDRPLAGFVAEGWAPYARVNNAIANALNVAAMSGMAVVRVGRGNNDGLSPTFAFDLSIEGNNLTSVKASLLLQAALLK